MCYVLFVEHSYNMNSRHDSAQQPAVQNACRCKRHLGATTSSVPPSRFTPHSTLQYINPLFIGSHVTAPLGWNLDRPRRNHWSTAIELVAPLPDPRGERGYPSIIPPDHFVKHAAEVAIEIFLGLL